jgi:phage repressor protein C with HTH and peptisase S24 domain
MLTISGDSMNPTLAHNDMVLIDTSKKHPTPPSIFVLFDGFGLVAKRCEYIETTGKIRLSSDNPTYSSYERSADEVVIVGRVVWFAREI